MPYDFLILALLFVGPGLAVYALRADLRPVIRLSAAFSLPFAFTEFLFYPDYWEPRFLFDLAARIGFGIEEFLFVAGLGAFASTAYPFFFNRTLAIQLDDLTCAAGRRRIASLFGATAAGVALLALLGIPMIYGAPAIMVLLSGYIVFRRLDLGFPALAGAFSTTAVYVVLCWAYALILPGVFQEVWRLEKFSNIFLLGIPLEVLVYGGAGGGIATLFLPYCTGKGYTSRNLETGSSLGRPQR